MIQGGVWKENTYLQNKPTEEVLRYLGEITSGHPDPLQAYLPYVSENQNLLLPVLKLFAKTAKYQNDPRYVQLWIIHAENVERPLKFYYSLLEKGIGLKCSYIYAAIADSHEANGQLTLAEEAYLRGICRRSKPFSKLKELYSQFAQRNSNFVPKSEETSIEEVLSLEHMRKLASETYPEVTPLNSPEAELGDQGISPSAYEVTPSVDKLYQSPLPVSFVSSTSQSTRNPLQPL